MQEPFILESRPAWWTFLVPPSKRRFNLAPVLSVYLWRRTSYVFLRTRSLEPSQRVEVANYVFRGRRGVSPAKLRPEGCPYHGVESVGFRPRADLWNEGRDRVSLFPPPNAADLATAWDALAVTEALYGGLKVSDAHQGPQQSLGMGGAVNYQCDSLL